MSEDQFSWPEDDIDDETDHYADVLDGGLMFAEDLPADHRSGFVAVVGRPNVGKSTLLNAYLQAKIAIVSPKAQTTRNRLLGILTRDKAQVIFVDTPGIHEPHHKFGQYMVEAALRSIPDADVILWLVDGSRSPHKEDQLVADAIRKMKERPPVILALNKVDLLKPDQVEAAMQGYLALFDQPDVAIAVSATEGHNRDKLLDLILERLPAGPRYFPADQITDQHLRFIASEMIREAALKVLEQEVPHALVAVVNEYKERSESMTYIEATVFVERDSQKGIVIGRQGKTLKRIGQLARAEIEGMTGGKVYLELHVKVRPKWRHKQRELKSFGYFVQDDSR